MTVSIKNFGLFCCNFDYFIRIQRIEMVYFTGPFLNIDNILIFRKWKRVIIIYFYWYKYKNIIIKVKKRKNLIYVL
jgi:hypothetical protein